MFLGEYTTKFSGFGRVILPKKLREFLSGEIIILSRGFEGCIFGFDKKTFEKEAKKQLEISATEERARLMRRYLFSASVPAELDSQGRFTVPSALLTYANLKGDLPVGRQEVIMIGAGDHFEIWNRDLWQKHLKRIEEEYSRGSNT